MPAGDAASALQHDDVLLVRSQVAALFRVHPNTVTLWADAGKLTPLRTVGGQRRYRESEVRALLASINPEAGAA
jgi:predicted site-specific integrase-resolvase